MPIFAKKLRNHSYFVHFSKLLLAGLALAILLAVGLLPSFQKDGAGLRLAFTSAPTNKDETNIPIMKNPRYQGVDNNNQPFLITAFYAQHKDKETVILKNVHANLGVKDNLVKVRADEANYSIYEKLLTLVGGVQLYYASGYQLETDGVLIDINKGEANSAGSVSGIAPFGTITANSLAAYDKGARVVFVGKVHMILHRYSASRLKSY